MLKDKFFWANYGKYSAFTALGCGLSMVVGVSPELAVVLTLGSIASFPAAYGLASATIAKQPKAGQASPHP